MFGKYLISLITILISLFFIKTNSSRKFENSDFESNFEKISPELDVLQEQNLKNILDLIDGISKKWNLKICETSDSERSALIENYINQNRDKMSNDDISLIKFIASDCLPVILFPGFYANKFQLQITNCTAINLYHPDIAKACGYDKKCENGFEEMFWLSENFETDDGKTCFGELGKFNLKKNETETDPKKKFYEEVYRGFKLTYWGNTPKTESKNECGLGASTNLLDKEFYFGKKSVKGFMDTKKHFLDLGYKIGVNLFSVPFDWRRNSNHEYNFHLAKETIDLAYNLTGKPSLLVCHSYGSIIALNYLYSVSQEEKQNKVSRLIAVGPPLTGANKSIKGFITGYEELNIKIKILFVKIIDLFFSMQNQKIMLYNTPAPLEMFPRFFWDNHKNDDWMNVVRNRAKVENTITECVRNYFKEKFGEKSTDSFLNYENSFSEYLDSFEEINGEDISDNEIDFLTSSLKTENNNSHKDNFIENSQDLKHHEALKYKILNSKNIRMSTSPEENKEILDKCINKIKSEFPEDLEKFKEYFPFFPDLVHGCGNESVNDATCLKLSYCKSSIWDQYCRLNFNTPLDKPLVEIKDGEEIVSFDLITKENVIEMIRRYGMAEPDLDYIEYALAIFSPDLNQLNHPGVPVTVYYSDFSMTPQRIVIPDNPKKYTDEDKLVMDVLGPEIIKYEGGDGTVPTSNAVMPLFKWTLDNLQGKKNPIHFVSYCTNPNYYGSDIKFDEHQYMNINCECNKPSAEACTHSSMISDKYVIEHITKYAVNSRNKIDISNLSEKIDLVGKGINHIEKDLICSNLKKVNEMFIFYE